MEDDTRGGASGEPVNPVATAEYVAELSTELAKLARQHGLNTLAYILDMARLEAEQVRANRWH